MLGYRQSRKPDRVDLQVSKRLKQRQLLISLSQEKIAEKMDISFQQFGRYECGKARISAGRLLQIANILGVPITYFFDETSVVSTFDETSSPPLLPKNKISMIS